MFLRLAFIFLVLVFLEVLLSDRIRDWNNFFYVCVPFKSGNVKALLFFDCKAKFLFEQIGLKIDLHLLIDLVHFFNFFHCLFILFLKGTNDIGYSDTQPNKKADAHEFDCIFREVVLIQNPFLICPI